MRQEKYMRETFSVCVLLIASLPVAAQSGAKAGEWRTYGGDLGNTHYSPADQINLRGGFLRGGLFRGGLFRGGLFRGGLFRGGLFRSGLLGSRFLGRSLFHRFCGGGFLDCLFRRSLFRLSLHGCLLYWLSSFLRGLLLGCHSRLPRTFICSAVRVISSYLTRWTKARDSCAEHATTIER